MQAILTGSGEELARKLRTLSSDETQRDGIIAANGHHGLMMLLSAGPNSKTTEYCHRIEHSH